MQLCPRADLRALRLVSLDYAVKLSRCMACYLDMGKAKMLRPNKRVGLQFSVPYFFLFSEEKIGSPIFVSVKQSLVKLIFFGPRLKINNFDILSSSPTQQVFTYFCQ